MKASLDTNVIIHLYRANQQNILFLLFGHDIVVYEFIVNQELKKHGSDIYDNFMNDVDAGKISIITDELLKKMGIYPLFLEYFNDDRPLYDVGDTGEVYAISLARVIGAVSIVTDDTKSGGPHATLMRLPDSDVIPFTFCEILFLLFIEKLITFDELIDVYEDVLKKSTNFNPSLNSEYRRFIERFFFDPYSERERKWMLSYCDDKAIDFETEIKKLRSYIKKYN